MDFYKNSEADHASTEIVCACSLESNDPTELTSRHLFVELAEKLPSAWEEIQDQLPNSYKWETEYVTTHGEGGRQGGCWTCTPLWNEEPEQVPLTIAGAPVVIPVEHRWPPVGGGYPPPDPRPSGMIDCRAEMPMDAIQDLFVTFEGILGFYVLINGLLQIIVPETFDITWASSHLPHNYGGLRVCYIAKTMQGVTSFDHLDFSSFRLLSFIWNLLCSFPFLTLSS